MDGADWRQRLLAGERAALARAITAVENDTPAAQAVLREIYPHIGRARVVGFTGAPGVGKSTLLSAYTHELRKRGQCVGVVAVDPSSPLSGGAILGDRIRMGEHAHDAGVFVRSLASRGHLGGLSRTAARVVDVMDAAGWEVIIVETVGTGQSEVEVSELAQTNVVICAPGLGDLIQALKAGVLETADVLVVNKADLPRARNSAEQLRQAMALRGQGAERPVVQTVATSGEGVAALADVIAAHGAALTPEEGKQVVLRRAERLIATAAAEQVRSRLARLPAEKMQGLCERLLKAEVGVEEAAQTALEMLTASE